MVGFGSKAFLVSVKFLLAIAAAKVNFAIFPIAGLVFDRGFVRNHALDFGEINFGICGDTNGSESYHECKQSCEP